MSSVTGKFHISKVEHGKGKQPLAFTCKIALFQRRTLLIGRRIVLLLMSYIAIVYSTLCLAFAAFPVLYQEARGWSQGIGGLSFLGVAVGIIPSIGLTVYGNSRYNRAAANYGGTAPPQQRLPHTVLGANVLAIGVFMFGWTKYLKI